MTSAVARAVGIRRGIGRHLLAMLLAGLALLLGTSPAPAFAHAQLLSITPADGAVLEQAPETVELLFNEPVGLVDGAIRLFPDEGAPVILEAQTRDHSVVVALPARLADGTYALSYRIVSADGHPVGGATIFHVGGPSSTSASRDDLASLTPASSEAAVRVLTVVQYLGLLAFAGLLFFRRMVLRRHGFGQPVGRRMVRVAFGAASAASVLLVPVSALRIVGEPLGMIFDPSTWAAGVRGSAVLAAIVVCVAGSGAYLLSKGRRSAGAFAMTFALVATAAPALVGHTQTAEPRMVMMAADMGHLVAGTFWTGGVIGLLLFLAAAGRRHRAGEGTAEQAAQVLGRFSRYALYSVILLTISGVTMAVLVLDQPGDLLETGYGRTLLLKLGVVASVVALAAWNRTRLLPRIIAEPTANLRWERLRRVLRHEAALLVAVIVVTGSLSNTSPGHHGPAQVLPQEASVSIESQGLVVEGTLTPTRAGQNTFVFRLTYNGEPVSSDEVQVAARLPEQGLGPFVTAPALDPATGAYSATLTLPVSGEWHIEVMVRVSTYAQPIAVIPVTIP